MTQNEIGDGAIREGEPPPPYPSDEMLDPACQKRLFHSRVSIMFIAIVFGAIAALSIFGFLFNLTINYPGTDRPVIAVDPFWMLGHVIRGLGLGLLTYYLWRYQSAIKNWRSPNGESTEQFFVAHAKAWGTGALVLGVLAIYAISYVAIPFVRR